ncbi:MAG: integrin alpha [Polyangiales bacterium]
MAGAGDVTRDGHPDLVVGAYTATAAYVFRGSSSGIATTPTSTITSSTSQFGLSVDGTGDVTNGDGFGDVVVGAQRGVRVHLPRQRGGRGHDALDHAHPHVRRVPLRYASTSGFGDYNPRRLQRRRRRRPGPGCRSTAASASGATLYQNLAILYTTFGQAIASLFGSVPCGWNARAAA